MELVPSLILTTWACGLAAGAALVAWWRVVGPGFVWLSAAVTALFGGVGTAVGGGWAAALATTGAIAGLVLARRPRELPAAAFAAAAVLYFVASVPDGGLLLSATGALALGGITGEMLLGHWYLIDPTLPRWALKRLAVIGGAGMAADAIGVLVETRLSWDDEIVGWAFLLLAVTTVLLTVAVWFALNEPSYPGVMAATGLSYLAILTAIGAVVAGRALIDEGSALLGGPVDLLGTIPFP
jgi:hypothetical protein